MSNPRRPTIVIARPGPPPPNPPGPPNPLAPPNPPPCWRASLMRSSSWSPDIELRGFDVLPETAMDSVALFGSIPGTGIPEGTTSLMELLPAS